MNKIVSGLKPSQRKIYLREVIWRRKEYLMFRRICDHVEPFLVGGLYDR